jgi:uncharacterized protein (TIGR00661 family)
MNILYAIQGTGNGHASRASEFIPLFREFASVDVLVSGNGSEVAIGQPVDYQLDGISYAFGRRGGIDIPKTLGRIRFRRFLQDVRNFPVARYDLVINDFEPVTAWAARRTGTPCVALSHQAAFLSPASPRPVLRNPAVEAIFRHFAPAPVAIGMHFRRYDTFIQTPVIRTEVRQLEPSDQGHITVYLPAYDHRLLARLLKNLRDTRFHVFSKTCKSPSSDGNIRVMPVSGGDYLKSLECCHGFITGGGFEGPAEGLFLGKKMMVIPMKNQYEQKCNAAALKELGVRVESGVRRDFPVRVRQWLQEARPVRIEYPDNRMEIVGDVLSMNIDSTKIPA